MELKKKRHTETNGNTEKETRTALARGIHVIGKLLRRIIEGISYIARPLIGVIGIVLIAALASIWISAIILIIFGYPFFDFLLPDIPFLTAIGITNILILIGVPILSLIFVVTELLYRIRLQQKWMMVIWILWWANLVSISLIGGEVYRNFKVKERSTNAVQLSEDVATLDTLHLQLGDATYLEDAFLTIDNEFAVRDRNLILADIDIHIEKAPSGQLEIIRQLSARGRNAAEARQLARNINFTLQMEHQTLVIPAYIEIEQGTKWRNQKVDIILKIPENTFVKFGEGTAHLVHAADIDTKRTHTWVGDDQVWKMTQNGLVLPDHPAPQSSSDVSSRSLSLSDFSKLNISGPFKVYVEKASHYSVRFPSQSRSGEEALNFRKEKGELYISNKGNQKQAPTDIYITMPALRTLTAVGTNDIKIKGFSEKVMNLNAEGVQNLKAEINPGKLTVHLSGKSDLDLIGKTDELQLTLEGNAIVDADAFRSRVVRLNAREGTHRINLYVKDTLHQFTNDKVTLNLTGDPVILKSQ